MESVWDYVMRRKPIFLGYFALFLASIFASCSLLNNLIPHQTIREPSVVQENPQTIQYDNLILSPQAVASLPSEPANPKNPTTPPDLVNIELANPAHEQSADSPSEQLSGSSQEYPADAPQGAPTGSTHNQPLEPQTPDNSEPTDSDDSQLAQTDTNQDQIAEVPLTSAPRKVSIFRTVLAVLLAVAALTLAGFSLYQAYEYFRPLYRQHSSRSLHSSHPLRSLIKSIKNVKNIENYFTKNNKQ